MDVEQEENGLEQQIRALLMPIMEDSDTELIRIYLGQGGHTQTLRVVVDRRGGVATGELERISRALALQLDVEDLFRNEYRLEVSSPGLSWPLTTDADFARYLDDWICVELHDGRTIEGRNAGLQGDQLQVQEKNKEITSYPRADIRKVKRAIDWASVSKRGKQRG